MSPSRGSSSVRSRRTSPKYEDYNANPTAGSSTSTEFRSYGYDGRRGYHEYSNTNNISGASSGGSYSNYRRSESPPKTVTMGTSRELSTTATTSAVASSKRRPTPSPPPPPLKPFIFKPTTLGRTPSPLRDRSSPTPSAESAAEPTPRRTEPTEDYLAISLQHSAPLDMSHEHDVHAKAQSKHKLIVLDLNGSLLLRSAHQRRAQPPPQPHWKGRGGTQGQYGGQPPALRTVHLRPYMAPFREYILHEKNKPWLDVMVWSSAQPHSVNDMVSKTFGAERQQELKAVWARDTLGLSVDDYHKKTQTFKDLEKPWAELPCSSSLISPMTTDTTTPLSTSSSPIILPLDEIEPSSKLQATVPISTSTPKGTAANETDQPTRHSAYTTLLIDDSPLKASLQPWNHLCIPEYTIEMRKADVAAALLRAEAEEQRARRNAELKARAEWLEAKARGDTWSFKNSEVGASVAARRDGNFPMDEQDGGGGVPKKSKKASKKAAARRRKEEDERTLAAQIAFCVNAGGAGGDIGTGWYGEPEAGGMSYGAPSPRADVAESAAATMETMAETELTDPLMRYDETLLAVVGILDAVKAEGNVAGWMRSGGLLNVGLGGKANEVERSGANTPVGPPPKKRRRVDDVTKAAEGMDIAPKEEEDLVSTQRSSSPPVMPPLSSQPSEDDAGSSSSRPSSPISIPEPTSGHGGPEGDGQGQGRGLAEQAATGVPPASTSEERSPETAAALAATSLWYENPAVMAYWAARGRRALQELGVAVESGVVVPT